MQPESESHIITLTEGRKKRKHKERVEVPRGGGQRKQFSTHSVKEAGPQEGISWSKGETKWENKERPNRYSRASKSMPGEVSSSGRGEKIHIAEIPTSNSRGAHAWDNNRHVAEQPRLLDWSCIGVRGGESARGGRGKRREGVACAFKKTKVL